MKFWFKLGMLIYKAKRLAVLFGYGLAWGLALLGLAYLLGIELTWRLSILVFAMDLVTAIMNEFRTGPSYAARERNIARVLATGEPCQPVRDPYQAHIRCKVCFKGPCTGAGPAK